MALLALRAPARSLVLILTVATGMMAGAAAPSFARDSAIDIDDFDVPTAPESDGSLVFHGNYCGPGSRGKGLPPVDALDAACMHHDACSPPVGTALPSCSCNARLAREASLVARSPRVPDDERVAAGFVAEGARILACR